jgi:hypothetical protein
MSIRTYEADTYILIRTTGSAKEIFQTTLSYRSGISGRQESVVPSKTEGLDLIHYWITVSAVMKEALRSRILGTLRTGDALGKSNEQSGSRDK